MYKRGQIVLVPFPFTDLSGSKIRPALIISNGAEGADVTVVFITSKKGKFKSCVRLTPSKDNGLKAISYAQCSKIATLDKKVILGDIGSLEVKMQKEVDVFLKKRLGL